MERIDEGLVDPVLHGGMPSIRPSMKGVDGILLRPTDGRGMSEEMIDRRTAGFR